MHSDIIKTTRLTDKTIMSLLLRILDVFPGAEVSVWLLGDTSLVFRKGDKVQSRIFTRASHSIRRFDLIDTATNRMIRFGRGVVDVTHWSSSNRSDAAQVFMSRRVPSAIYDEIGFFRADPNRGEAALSIEQSTLLDRILSGYLVPTDASDDNSLMYANALAAKQIDDLRAINLEVVESLNRSREALEEEYRSLRDGLKGEQEAKSLLLKQEKEELDKWRSEINDREPQHERRRLREVLTSRIQDSLRNPDDNVIRRESSVYWLYLATGAAFILLSAGLTLNSEYGSQIGSAAFWAQSIKSLVAGFAGAAFTWAGLSGLKNAAIAAREHVRIIEKYSLDMDRASWIVETILQMNSVEKSEVPLTWLESACHGLFTGNRGDREEQRSLDAFAALFDATARAKIGTAGIEFEVDRRGAKRLAQGN